MVLNLKALRSQTMLLCKKLTHGALSSTCTEESKFTSRDLLLLACQEDGMMAAGSS